MKQFSLLVRVPITYTKEQAKAVNPEWDKLLNEWRTKDIYITSFAFPGEGYVVSGMEREIAKEAVIANNLKVVSNIFLRANCIEDAVELAKGCPILGHGGTVEVREIPPRP
jgi:hypothetical protein